jgi:hypothetical protein
VRGRLGGNRIPTPSDAEESSKNAIEIHMDNIIKNYSSIWMGYKRRLAYVHTILKKLELQTRLSVIEGDSYIRFKSDNDYASLNSFFFVYEMGKVFPISIQRHLIGTGVRYNYYLLNRSVSFLPAFSFSLDQQMTLLYWGEQVPYLSTEDLKNLKLANFILKTSNPASVEVSASNICWPKCAFLFQRGDELERCGICYLFNSLMPPILDANEIWFESPFILIGDRTVRISTIHKTLCSIDKRSIKPIEERKVFNVKASIIDRNFNLKHILVDVPEEYIDQLMSSESFHEVVFVKDIRLNAPTINEQRPYVRYTVYPFESVKVLGGENYGLLLTITSIILRVCYLRSKDPFYFTLTSDEFKQYLAKIFRQFPYSHTNELGLKLVESREGLKVLLSLLGVYDLDGQFFIYFHPALLECFLSNLKGPINKNNLIRIQRIVYNCYKKADSFTKLSGISLIKDLFRKEFGIVPNDSQAIKLIQAVFSVIDLCIPLSKFFNSWPEGDYHA